MWYTYGNMCQKNRKGGCKSDEENVNVQQEMKFCSECGQKVMKKAIVCPHCGCQIGAAEVKSQPQVVINNSNQNSNNNVVASVPYGARMRNKWTAFFLCLFLGWFGAHKFYEGNFGAGVLYALTGGLFGFGWFFNTLSLLGKPNPYYVY